MELRPYDIELLRGEMRRYPLEETVIIKKELLDELLNSYEDADDDTNEEVIELKERLAEAEQELDGATSEIERLQDELDRA